ncbi:MULTISPECIES: polysaccharide biosynthesis/export family protein [Flavobacteriaceae]|uniref:Sugar transporter n=2 Tax=Flavobacteriaceae TaxID=49546 RepID=A0A4Y8ASY6_9FLAO|nr:MULTISPECIES: polysaccharide biosynthesis/export family protein [Flavobacteriaceae]TEW74968.1 sugar transporter [Gramella jeungdoensis]GGK42683.1 polysaccharide biosynthesis protein [Lutibacter litoralis]
MKINYLYKFTLLFLMLITISSCVSKKDMIYFQNDETISNELYKNYAPKIQTADILNITVSAREPDAVKAYNLTGGGGQTTKPITYLVDKQGDIIFPELGKIKVGGLTTEELKANLISRLEVYITNPIVTIRLENFRVSILGEVKSPGPYNLENEKVSIPEALAMAGDLTIQGKRKNILLLRTTGDKVESIRLDLTDKSLFKSPYFYLAQNDIVYVEPNKAKVNSSAIGTTSSLISIASALLSLVLILTR